MLRVRSTSFIFLGLIGFVAVCAAASHPAVGLVDRATTEMRTDPEASKRDADQALRLLEKQPDADLEVQARLVLCDYYAERDGGAVQSAALGPEGRAARLPRSDLRKLGHLRRGPRAV